jgi:hypothetical protein
MKVLHCIEIQQAKYNLVRVNNYADGPIARDRFLYFLQLLIQSAFRNIPTNLMLDGSLSECALSGHTHCNPVGFPRDIIIDFSESSGFEPRRGSCAEVSLIIPAIDDYRTISI